MGRAGLQSTLGGAELQRAWPARAPAGSGPFSSGARPAGPALARPGGVPAPGSVAVRAARVPARAPAAPQLPAGEPIGARRGGGHFLVCPAARSGQLGRPRAGRELRGAALPASADSAAKGGRRSLKAHRCKPDKKKLWGAGSAGWRGVRFAFRAWSLGLVAPGSEMSKPPPKPVKPGKGGARRVLRPPQCLALLLPLGRADQARRRP